MPELNVRWSGINHDSILLSGQAERKAATEGAESFSTHRGPRAMLPRLLAESQTLALVRKPCPRRMGYRTGAGEALWVGSRGGLSPTPEAGL